MKASNTKKAFACLLAAPVYVVVFCMLMELSSLDIAWRVEILGKFLGVTVGFLLLFSPLVLGGLGIGSLVFASRALRGGESKRKNSIMIAITVALMIFAVVFGFALARGILHA